MLTLQEKSATNKIVLSKPVKFHCSCQRFLSYRADTKRSSVFMRQLCRNLKLLKNRIFFQIQDEKIPSSSVENVASTVVETSSQSLHGNERVSNVCRTFNISYSILRVILCLYPFKIKLVHLLQDRDLEIR